MNSISETFKMLGSVFGIFILIFFFISAQIAIGLIVASMLSVIITYIVAKIKGVSYYELCDTSDTIYRLNTIGKWSWIIVGGLLLFYGLLLILVLI